MNCAEVFWKTSINFPHADALDINGSIYKYKDIAQIAKNIQVYIERLNQTEVVAVFGNKTAITYSAIIGIISSGKIYCPIGNQLPTERQVNVFEEARADTIIIAKDYFEEAISFLKKLKTRTVVITETDISDEIKKQLANIHVISLDKFKDLHSPKVKALTSDSIAYLLFTSGSTGKPKGVPISHGNLISYLKNLEKRIKFGSNLKFSQVFPLTFDLSIHDIFVCWKHAGILIPIPEKLMLAPAKFIKEKKIEVWFSVPSQISLLHQLGLLKKNMFPNIKISMFCGEALTLDGVQKWIKAAKNSEVYNLYGPTEATIAITSYKLPSNKNNIKSKYGIVSIGKIFKNHEIKIIKKELILKGPQVTKKYWNNISKSSKVFSNSRGISSYKTGDLIEMTNNNIFYVARKDNQVKINGNRVELEEINTELGKLIHNAIICTINQTTNFGDLLFSFVETKFKFDEYQIRNKLRKVLPDYMIPRKIIHIVKIPLNHSGKVDTKTLRKELNNVLSNKRSD